MFLKHPISAHKSIIHMWPHVKEIMESDGASRKLEENLLRDGILWKSGTLQCVKMSFLPVKLQQSLMKIRRRFILDFLSHVPGGQSRVTDSARNMTPLLHDFYYIRNLLVCDEFSFIFCGYFITSSCFLFLLNGYFICMMCHRFMFRCLFKKTAKKMIKRRGNSRAIHYAIINLWSVKWV